MANRINNAMEKNQALAYYFIGSRNLEARVDIWADGVYVRAFEKGSPNFYCDSFGNKLIIPRRMGVREFNKLVSSGGILSKDEVKSLEETYKARSVYYKFTF